MGELIEFLRNFQLFLALADDLVETADFFVTEFDHVLETRVLLLDLAEFFRYI